MNRRVNIPKITLGVILITASLITALITTSYLNPEIQRLSELSHTFHLIDDELALDYSIALAVTSFIGFIIEFILMIVILIGAVLIIEAI